MHQYNIDRTSIMWIPVGDSHENFTNEGNYPIIWITAKENPHFLIASAKTSTKTLTEGVKRVLSYNGHSIKNPEKEEIAQWLRSVRFPI